jgi:hypothetical protein
MIAQVLLLVLSVIWILAVIPAVTTFGGFVMSKILERRILINFGH